jgi:hypothetical protein
MINDSSKDLEDLRDWDLHFFEGKWGSQGEAAPLKQRLHTFNEYFEHLESPAILQDPLFKKAIQIAIHRFGFNESGDPLTAETVVAQGLTEDKYGTNSAYDKYTRKKNPTARVAAIKDAPSAIRRKFPNTPSTRSTPGKTGTEARNIFMTAMAVVVNGQRYQKPLQEYIRSKGIEYVAPWDGFDKVQTIASKFEDRTWKLSADYDKMDQHFNKYHAKAVYEVIKHYFKPKYWAELEEIIDYVFTQPILTNLGYINQDHALVSGSEWTNFLETIWNYIFWIWFELKYHIQVKHAMGIGDDQLIEFLNSERWTDKEADKILDLIIAAYMYAGTPGNKEKNLFSRDTFEFCQRKAVKNWYGYDHTTKWALVYRLSRNAEMNTYPESFHNDKMVEDGKKVNIYNKFTFAIQVIMRSENSFQHPGFKAWIKFIAHCNPVIKEFCQLKDSEIRIQEQRARRISTLFTTYNQEKQDKPLTSFVTLKELRSYFGL